MSNIMKVSNMKKIAHRKYFDAEFLLILNFLLVLLNMNRILRNKKQKQKYIFPKVHEK